MTQTVDPQSLTPVEATRLARAFQALAVLSGGPEPVLTYDDLTPQERRQGFVWALID